MLLKQFLHNHLKKLLLIPKHLLVSFHLRATRFMEWFPIEHPYHIDLGHPDRIVVLLVGCGGVGSFAAQVLAQVAHWAGTAGLDLRLYFIDPGLVEMRNLGRHNFCSPELAQARAQTLAWRYSTAFGLSIQGVISRFRRNMLNLYRPGHSDRMAMIIVSTVAEARARRDIAEAILSWSEGRLGPRSPGDQIWWLDATSRSESEGLVTIGNSFHSAPILSPDGLCQALPFPHLQEPALLRDRTRPPESGDADLDNQETALSREIAAWVGIYLYRLLQGQLDLRATRIYLERGIVHSTPITAWSLPTSPGKPAPAAGFERIAFDRGACLACGQPLVRSRYFYQGVFLGQLSCSRCVHQEEVCPECWEGRIDYGERAHEGEQVPAFYCTKCPWAAVVPVEYRAAPLQTRPVGWLQSDT